MRPSKKGIWVGILFMLTALILPPSVRAQDDHQIVPGQSVGPIRIGMSSQALYKLMGEPTESQLGESGRVYFWGELQVYVDSASNTVSWMRTSRPQDALGSGVTIGSSLLALQAIKTAPPRWTKTIDQGADALEYCYDDGLIVASLRGKVSGFTVVSPGCSN